MRRLPDAELEVMKALWRTGPDTPRAALEAELTPFGWAANTVNTYLSRLADKGFVAVRRAGKSNLYTPLVSREEYQAFDSRAVLSRLYGSPRNFVASLAREAGGFRLESAQGERLWCARCVLACGGKASPKHSWEGGGYALAQALGHRVTELRPALTALKSPKKCLRSLKGMRVRAKASLLAAGKPLYQESGEVLFGEGSLSGICVFNLSAHLPENGTGVEVSLDLLEDLPYRDALAYVESQAKAHPSRQAWELFAGALNLRVGEELLKELSVPKEACFQDLSRQQLRKAASLAKDWRFPVTGTGGWEGAQVTAGGVPLGEVDTATLESKKCPGLYLAGELLHLHGDCGGYNLHWAWATGLAAGQSAGGRKGKGIC